MIDLSHIFEQSPQTENFLDDLEAIAQQLDGVAPDATQSVQDAADRIRRVRENVANQILEEKVRQVQDEGEEILAELQAPKDPTMKKLRGGVKEHLEKVRTAAYLRTLTGQEIPVPKLHIQMPTLSDTTIDLSQPISQPRQKPKQLPPRDSR